MSHGVVSGKSLLGRGHKQQVQSPWGRDAPGISRMPATEWEGRDEDGGLGQEVTG